MKAGWLLLMLASACAALGGCYNPEDVNGFLLKPRAPVSGAEYRVLPPDQLQVNSLHVPEIAAQRQQIRPDGKINLPLVGEIAVAGKTCKEIEQAINEAARVYYEQTDATVTVGAFMSQSFYIFGQVGRAGPQPWTGHDTLLDALAKAQPTPLAWPERIVVVRAVEPKEGGWNGQDNGSYKRSGERPPQDPNNKPNKLTMNLMAMMKSGDLSNNVLLLPNDIIYVQPNPLAAIGLAFQNLIFPIRPGIEAVGAPARAAAGAGMP